MVLIPGPVTETGEIIARTPDVTPPFQRVSPLEGGRERLVRSLPTWPLAVVEKSWLRRWQRIASPVPVGQLNSRKVDHRGMPPYGTGETWLRSHTTRVMVTRPVDALD